MIWFILYLASIVLATVIGARKGEGIGAFVLGVVLGPFAVVVAWFSAGKRRPNRARK